MITTKFFIPLLLISLALIFCLNTVSAAPGDTIYVNGSDETMITVTRHTTAKISIN